METPTSEKPPLTTEILKSAAAALIPTFILFLLTYVINFLVPESEIRILPALVSEKSVYVVIENHNHNSLGPITIYFDGSSDVKSLIKSDFADIDIKNDPNSSSSIATISRLIPLKRTTILFYSETSFAKTKIYATILPINTKTVYGNEDSFSKSYWLNIIIQCILYFIAFIVMNMMRRSSVAMFKDTKNELEKVKENLKEDRIISRQRAESLENKIGSIRSTYVKRHLYNTRIYEKIEKENKIWRSVVLDAMRKTISDSGNLSVEIMRNLLFKAGVKDSSKLADVDLRTFILAMESDDKQAFQIALDGPFGDGAVKRHSSGNES